MGREELAALARKSTSYSDLLSLDQTRCLVCMIAVLAIFENIDQHININRTNSAALKSVHYRGNYK